MKNREIIDAAMTATRERIENTKGGVWFTLEQRDLAWALQEARKDEREACADNAENYDLGTIEGHAIAKIIRSRGK